MNSDFSDLFFNDAVVEYAGLVDLPLGAVHAVRKVSFGVGKL